MQPAPAPPQPINWKSSALSIFILFTIIDAIALALAWFVTANALLILVDKPLYIIRLMVTRRGCLKVPEGSWFDQMAKQGPSMISLTVHLLFSLAALAAGIYALANFNATDGSQVEAYFAAVALAPLNTVMMSVEVAMISGHTPASPAAPSPIGFAAMPDHYAVAPQMPPQQGQPVPGAWPPALSIAPPPTFYQQPTLAQPPPSFYQGAPSKSSQHML